MVRAVKTMHAVVDPLMPAQMPECYESREMNLTSFLKRLNTVTELHGVFNEIKENEAQTPGTVGLTGLWLGKSELPENGSDADIRLIWHTHPTTKRVQMTSMEWSRRRYFFWEYLMHELVHRVQAIYRDSNIRVYRPQSTERDTKEEQQYYGNYDEIEAHSHNAAMEFHVWWPDLPYRECIREALQFGGRLITPTWCCYEATFGDTPKHPAMRHFKRKTRAWWDYIKKDPDIYQQLELPKLCQ